MYDKITFAKAFGASLGIMLLVAAIGVYGGLAYAVPVSGAGSYTVTIDHIEATNAVVYPAAVQTPNGDQESMSIVELESAEITGLEIVKTVNLPVGQRNVVISSDETVTTESLLLKASTIEAESSNLQSLELVENPEQGDFAVTTGQAEDAQQGQSVDINNTDANSLVLEDATLETQYLVTNSIDIPGLSVKVVPVDSSG